MLAATAFVSHKGQTQRKASPSWKMLMNAVQAHSSLTCAGRARAQISSARYALAPKKASMRVSDKLKTITHMGTSTKVNTELVRRNTDAPGAGRVHVNIVLCTLGARLLTRHSGRLGCYDVPRREYKDESVEIGEECFIHISLKHEGHACMGSLTKKDSPYDKKGIVHRVPWRS